MTTKLINIGIYGLENKRLTIFSMLCVVRWQQDLENLKKDRVKLVGDCLLGAGFLCYVGAFSWEFRHNLVYTDWLKNVQDKEIPCSDPYKLEDLLNNDVEVSR